MSDKENNFNNKDSADKPFYASNQNEFIAQELSANARVDIAQVTKVTPISNCIEFKWSSGITSTAIYIPNLFSQMLGLTTHMFPEVGSTIIILSIIQSPTSTTNFAIGVLPSYTRAVGTSQTSTYYTGQNINDNYQEVIDTNSNASKNPYLNRQSGLYPVDMVDGEFTSTTKTGTGIDILFNLCRLKGSPLAAVETYLLDDLVRIISKNFEHISSFGDYKILNTGGGLDVIWNGTINEYEANDLSNADDKKEGVSISDEGGMLDYDANDENLATYSDAKWRFTSYIGKIGNIIHTYITDPGASISKDSINKAGRHSIHVNADGSIIVQSISDIVFEKVVRIPIPIAETRIEEMIDTAKSELKAYEVWTPLADEEPYEVSYKLKDYTKWLSNYYSLAEFYNKKSKDQKGFKIPSEDESPIPDSYLKDKNFQSINSSGTYTKQFNASLTAYATIRIFKDGSIVLYDAYGSAIHMTAGNVNISAAKSINLSAAENINLKAGKDLTLTAVNNIEMTAMLKGILIKSRQWLEMLCTKGCLLLESTLLKAQTAPATDPEYKSRLDKAKGNGIVISTANSSNDRLTCSNISIKTYGSLFTDAYYYANRCKYVLFDLWNATGQFVISKALSVAKSIFQVNASILKAASLNAEAIATKTNIPVVLGGTTQKTLVRYDDNTNSYPNGKDFQDGYDTASSADIALMNSYGWSNSTNGWMSTIGTKFTYRPADLYNTTSNEGNNKIFQTLTDQQIEAVLSTEGELYIQYASDELLSDIPVNRNYPFPGKQACINKYNPTIKDLNKPITQKGSALLSNNKAMTKVNDPYAIWSYNTQQ